MTQINNGKTVPSELGLLTIAKVTLSEEDRMAAAKRWLSATSVFGDREKHLLNGFWNLLDTCPQMVEVTDIKARHVVYR